MAGSDAGRGALVAILDGDVEVARWRVPPDGVGLAQLDELARLHVAARRRGLHVRVTDACATLCALVQLAGLDNVLDVTPRPGLRLEPGGQPEQLEQPRVEEVVQRRDPPP